MRPTQPSTSQQDGEITAEQFNKMVQENNAVLLDCRSDGESVKKASRVRLPIILYRRLVAGNLRMHHVHDDLKSTPEECPDILLIPGEYEADQLISSALVKTAKTNGYKLFVLIDPVTTLLSKFPNLRVKSDENWNSFATLQPNVDSKPKGSGPPVGFLNLNALRLESENQESKQRSEFPVELTSFLYLGNAETAKNRDALNKHSISYVINVTSNLPNYFEDDSTMSYLRISVDDNSSHNLTKYFSEATAFIDEARRNNSACLVHCLAGISRSVTICLAYLMKTEMCTLDSAYEWVQTKNASIAPNFHFMGQLTDYERMLGLKSNRPGTYPSSAPRSPSCAIEAAASVGLLTPPPTSCSASPQSSTHSAKSFH